MRLFLDTNIFLCYATDFEQNHTKCQALFHGKHDRHTGQRVTDEIRKIKNRRANIYRDLSNFLRQGTPLANFQPSLPLNRNDEIHLHKLFNSLRTMSANDALTYTRRIGRVIDQGIKHALSLVIRPLIQPSGDLACEVLMETCIGNGNDSRIFVDALCWSENTSKATFCTLDYSNIISKRPDIYRKIIQIRAYRPSDIPLEIVSLGEFFPRNSNV